jgi:ribosomal-protein-alanine N-acetyltransferase
MGKKTNPPTSDSGNGRVRKNGLKAPGQNVVFESDRLRFATWNREDAEQFRELAADPLVLRYVSAGGEPWPEERIQEFVARQIENWEMHGICLWKLLPKDSDKLVGLCGLQQLPEGPDVEIGWWLAPSYWGKGYATEAASRALAYGFGVRKLNRIVAIAQAVNLDSIRVMDRLGMRFEREAIHKGLHVVLYAIAQDHFAMIRAERDARA